MQTTADSLNIRIIFDRVQHAERLRTLLRKEGHSARLLTPTKRRQYVVSTEADDGTLKRLINSVTN